MKIIRLIGLITGGIILVIIVVGCIVGFVTNLVEFLLLLGISILLIHSGLKKDARKKEVKL